MINGTYAGDTIGVVDFVDGGELHKYERVILFLHPIFSDMFFGDNDYVIATHGKFLVDDNLLVHGTGEGMSLEDFQNKITDAISEYALSNDTQADLYRNDTDLADTEEMLS